MILRNSFILAFFSILSVLLGIVRDRLLAVYVGVGPTLDVYNAAFRIPDLLYGVFLAFITAGTVVPFLTKENKNGEIIESEKRFSALLFFFSSIMIFLIIFVFFTLPLYARAVVPGFTDEQLREFIFATRILMLQPLFLGVSSLISCFAQLKNEFIYYGIAPLGYSLSIIFGIVFLYRDIGVNGLVFGVIMGALTSLLIQAISLRKHKFSIRRAHFNIKYIYELLRFALPRSFTNLVSQARVMFLTAFATTLGVGVLSSFLFAQRITDAITQIISQSLTTASLPVLSREHEEGRIKEHEKLVHHYTRLLFVSAACISVVVYFLRVPVVSILYSRNPANHMIATLLVGFLIAMPFSMASSYLAVGFYSMKDTKRVLIGNILGSMVCVLVCLVFRDKGVISLMFGIISYYATSSTTYFILYKQANFLKNGSRL